jgi:hypothetical protein
MMRGMRAVLVGFGVVVVTMALAAPATAKKKSSGSSAAPAASEKQTSSPEEIKTKFKTFCDGWMEKLRERERNNIAHIEWKPGGGGVVGEYVGYDTQNFTVGDITNAETKPIGRVIYMELKMRLSGSSQVDALAQKPEIVERTEVTELFRYDRGNWVY